MKCDNDSSMGHCIVTPQCFKGEVTRLVTVKYNMVEKDELSLCEECAKALARDARRHRYKLHTQKLRR